jgi:hypothetical protein
MPFKKKGIPIESYCELIRQRVSMLKQLRRQRDLQQELQPFYERRSDESF